jgi:hypothetical protein
VWSFSSCPGPSRCWHRPRGWTPIIACLVYLCQVSVYHAAWQRGARPEGPPSDSGPSWKPRGSSRSSWSFSELGERRDRQGEGFVANTPSPLGGFGAGLPGPRDRDTLDRVLRGRSRPRFAALDSRALGSLLNPLAGLRLPSEHVLAPRTPERVPRDTRPQSALLSWFRGSRSWALPVFRNALLR